MLALLLLLLGSLLRRGLTVSWVDTEGSVGPPGAEIFFFVAALNQMQREEAAQDGSTAGAFERERTRAGAPLRKALELELAATTTDYICDALAASRSDEAYMLAQDDLAADPEWAGDRLLIIERGMALVADGMPTEGPELEEHNALYQEYLNAWKAKALERLLEFRKEYEGKSRAKLVAAYIKMWADNRSHKTQVDESYVTSLLYAVRACAGVRAGADAPIPSAIDHSRCAGHQQMVFESRAEVRDMPQEMRDVFVETLNRIDMEGSTAAGK